VVSFTPLSLPPRKQPPGPTVQEAGWTAEPVWTLWIREKSVVPGGNRTLSVPPIARGWVGEDFDEDCCGLL
jgi:hypothetical protein